MATPAEPGKPLTEANRITMAEIEALQAANRAVVIYPRNGTVIVDGFNRYQLAGTMLSKRQQKEAQRAQKEKTQGCDVRTSSDVRPVINEPDRLADSIAKQFKGTRLDGIRTFYRHRPHGDMWFLVETMDHMLRTQRDAERRAFEAGWRWRFELAEIHKECDLEEAWNTYIETIRQD
jgi:hypothetical protein